MFIKKGSDIASAAAAPTVGAIQKCKSVELDRGHWKCRSGRPALSSISLFCPREAEAAYRVDQPAKRRGHAPTGRRQYGFPFQPLVCKSPSLVCKSPLHSL